MAPAIQDSRVDFPHLKVEACLIRILCLLDRGSRLRLDTTQTEQNG